jgi:hypothetical protein
VLANHSGEHSGFAVADHSHVELVGLGEQRIIAVIVPRSEHKVSGHVDWKQRQQQVIQKVRLGDALDAHLDVLAVLVVPARAVHLVAVQQRWSTPPVALREAPSPGSQSFFKDIIGRFKPLDTEELYETYCATQSRLILLNCDSFAELFRWAAPRKSLSVDKKNVLFLVNIRSQREMEAKCGQFTYLGLVAEHGYYHRWPMHKLQLITQSQPVIDWQCTMQHLDLMWQKPTIATMKCSHIKPCAPSSTRLCGNLAARTPSSAKQISCVPT